MTPAHGPAPPAKVKTTAQNLQQVLLLSLCRLTHVYGLGRLGVVARGRLMRIRHNHKLRARRTVAGPVALVIPANERLLENANMFRA